MRIFYMKQRALDSLQADIASNLKKYQSKTSWVEQYFIDKNIPKYFFDTQIEVNDYQLFIGGPETDFQNAKVIYEAFRGKLNLVQAGDLRLWAYLAHVTHWDYMFNRWKADAPDKEDALDFEKDKQAKAIKQIKSRYFFGESRGKAFVRQGIARLYWGAYLTYDETLADPYEYTEFLFSKQDIFTSITERSYARNKTVVLAALKELKKHPELSRDEIRLFLLRLNQAGAITVLDFLNAEQAADLCQKIMDQIHSLPRIIEGSSFRAYNPAADTFLKFPFIIKKGKPLAAGKPFVIKPRTLIGKKEGSKIVISGHSYVIKDIQPGKKK